MPVHEILLDELGSARDAQRRAWCTHLEAGGILYFPRTPVPIPASDLQFLLGQRQTASNLHKNIAYKPDRDQLSGVDHESASAADIAELQAVMRRYSAAVESFLADFLAPYVRRWRLDYASFRPLDEEGRDLPVRRRNDLLHTDAFPTRPTRGWRILRFFHNIHPTRTRDWVVGDPFPRIVGVFSPSKLATPQPDGAVIRAAKQLAEMTGLAHLVPQWKRTPYDAFMMQLHNTMKEDSEFQAKCAREDVKFAPGSSWMVFTETVPHAVLGGQYALEQTFLVDPAAMVTPSSAPIAVLEKMAGARLV
jgi:hypothetical protein